MEGNMKDVMNSDVDDDGIKLGEKVCVQWDNLREIYRSKKKTTAIDDNYRL